MSKEPKKYRILVCGGRTYSDKKEVKRVLDHLYPRMSHLMTGAARGVDMLASEWQRANDYNPQYTEFQAEWDKFGYAAGPIRNKKMLRDGKPDMVVHFPGGRGTANMLKIAKEAGVPTYEAALIGKGRKFDFSAGEFDFGEVRL